LLLFVTSIRSNAELLDKWATNIVHLKYSRSKSYPVASKQISTIRHITEAYTCKLYSFCNVHQFPIAGNDRKTINVKARPVIDIRAPLVHCIPMPGESPLKGIMKNYLYFSLTKKGVLSRRLLVFPIYAIKGIAQLNLNLDRRWRWMVNFTPRPFYLGKELQYPLNKRLCGLSAGLIFRRRGKTHAHTEI